MPATVEVSLKTVYLAPGRPDALMSYQYRYEHWIGGEAVPPAGGQYFENPTPITGQAFCEVARGTADDVERALDPAHAAAPAWGKTSPAERAEVLNRIADRMAMKVNRLALAESFENGKPIRETLAADIPLAVDHPRYFAGAIRAQEGALSEIDEDTVAYHFHEPLGVVAQIIPWNFPILMAIWKLAPALAAGNAVVLKPAEQTPASVHYLMSLITDLLPPGVVNIVNGFGVEAGKPLACSGRVAKVAFTGETQPSPWTLAVHRRVTVIRTASEATATTSMTRTSTSTGAPSGRRTAQLALPRRHATLPGLPSPCTANTPGRGPVLLSRSGRCRCARDSARPAIPSASAADRGTSASPPPCPAARARPAAATA